MTHLKATWTCRTSPTSVFVAYKTCRQSRNCCCGVQRRKHWRQLSPIDINRCRTRKAQTQILTQWKFLLLFTSLHLVSRVSIRSLFYLPLINYRCCAVVNDVFSSSFMRALWTLSLCERDDESNEQKKAKNERYEALARSFNDYFFPFTPLLSMNLSTVDGACFCSFNRSFPPLAIRGEFVSCGVLDD